MKYHVLKQRSTKLPGLTEEIDCGTFSTKEGLFEFIESTIKDETNEVFDRTKAIYANDKCAKEGIFLGSEKKDNPETTFSYYLYFTPDDSDKEYLITSLNNYALYNQIRCYVNDILKSKDNK